MPQEIHQYIPESRSDSPWFPAVHKAFGHAVLLRLPDPHDAGAMGGYAEIADAVRSCSSPYLLPSRDISEGRPPVCLAVTRKNYIHLTAGQIHGKMTPARIDQHMLCLSMALEHLNREGLAMCALTPDHVLVKDHLAGIGSAIADFSAAQFLCAYAPRPLSERAAAYAAPEVLSASGVTAACDVYSLGLIYLAYLTGAEPAADDRPAYIARSLKKVDLLHRKLIGAMLETQAAARISAREATVYIQRLLISGNCYLNVESPRLAGKNITITSSGGYRSWTRLDENGNGRFGPLFSDEEFALTCAGEFLTKYTFPTNANGQRITLCDDTPADEPAQGEPAQPPAPRQEQRPEPTEPEREPAPEPQSEAPAAPPRARRRSAPAAAPAPAPAPVPAQAPVSAPAATPAPVPGPQQRDAAPQTRLTRTVRPEAPINNIRLIEVFSDRRARLTLISGGAFFIRLGDAPRYGIAHLLQDETGR